MSDSEYEYCGSELELFQHAINWKKTLQRHIRPYLVGDVLEVGAGIGGTTKILRDGTESSWTSLEPDPSLASTLADADLPVKIIVGALDALSDTAAFDTILYIDVLEHIEDERGEVERAAAHLNPGGRLIVLSPAHQFLFSPFDEAVGHFRRYSKASLSRLTVDSLEIDRMRYLDSVGFFASLANKCFLSQTIPTAGQISFWDFHLVRLSRVVDPLLFHSFGKSILGVWRRV